MKHIDRAAYSSEHNWKVFFRRLMITYAKHKHHSFTSMLQMFFKCDSWWEKLCVQTYLYEVVLELELELG